LVAIVALSISCVTVTTETVAPSPVAAATKHKTTHKPAHNAKTQKTKATSGSSNGVGSKSPSQILNSAVQALKSAQSVRISVSATGEKGAPFTVDFYSFSNGDLQGSASLDGNPAEIVQIGQTIYINADVAYWTTSGATQGAANELANLWVSGPATGSYTGYGIPSLVSSFESSSASAGTTGTVDGQASVSVRFATGTLWVATKGKAYPIEVKGPSGTVIFSDWNKGTPPTAPAGAQPASSITGG
jgi:hypothetical protein